MIYIIGYGSMAKAIAGGLKNKKEFAVVGRDEKKLKEFSQEFNCKYYLLDGFDISGKIILLTVKPYALQEVSMRLKGEADVLISILAGKSLLELERIKAKAYIRAMPNVAAKYNASTTAITGDIEAKDIAMEIFSAIGTAIWMENDDEIDMATAIIGSGPAFLALIAEAFSDGGVYIGLKRDKAIELTKGLFKSFAAIDDNYSSIKDSVMSPKGTTAEGVYALEEEGIRGKIIKAVKKTYEKSKKI
ncbi:pyrroline-5-carboxylate reductase [Nautilia profundicola AmH]|uniref:Pyrroline-5-carboxylate reductase n=1 Tax=Nautilia profundicola (strain ATCC BAA-1463 / DSM 18972 / AmH) TaxID=598659 RepID=B9L9C9_NAUPA|nr:pyrroline-5-carboxylate reductase [Nautilia profundicola]ACM92781.1 pyrroline-5-carboxylate reductase [Nautilia profundicola AmH]